MQREAVKVVSVQEGPMEQAYGTRGTRLFLKKRCCNTEDVSERLAVILMS